jgi:hypothetical protein
MRKLIIVSVVMITGCAADPNMDNWRAIMATPSYRQAPVVMPPVIIYQQPAHEYPAFNNLYNTTQPNYNRHNYVCPYVGANCF